MMKHTNIQLFKPYPDGVILKKLTIEDRYIKKRVQFLYIKQCVFPKLLRRKNY